MVKLRLQYLASQDTFKAMKEDPVQLVWNVSGPIK